jgi:hypothetical protein
MTANITRKVNAVLTQMVARGDLDAGHIGHDGVRKLLEFTLNHICNHIGRNTHNDEVRRITRCSQATGA